MKVTNLIVFVSIDNLHFERFCIEPAHFLCEWPIGIVRIVEADVDDSTPTKVVLRSCELCESVYKCSIFSLLSYS